MKDTNLVDVLRAYEEWAEWNHRETPIAMGDNLAEAADLIEAQAKEIEKLRAQIVHGRWIYDEKAQRPYCSVCKEYFYGATNSSMNYCSNCGAEMDGKNG